MFDDEPVVSNAAVTLGESLSTLSIEDLEERITALSDEIKRVEAELRSKRSGRAAAEAVFGS